MTRRAGLERLEVAWREATRARLISSGMSAETADAWLPAWALQATQDGVGTGAQYWDGRLDLDRSPKRLSKTRPDG